MKTARRFSSYFNQIEKQDRKTKIALSISAIGLLLFIIILLTIPFGNQSLLSKIFKKDPSRAAATNINFNLGAESRVFTAQQFNKGSYPDTHTSFVKDAANQFRVFMAAGREMYMLVGPNENQLVPYGGASNPTAVLGPSLVDGAPDENYASAGEVFIDPSNPNRLIAFYHGENHCAQGWTTFVASILVGTSTDNGQTWTRNGEVISGFNEQPCASAGRPAGSGELSAIKVGNYYYIYFITWAPNTADEIHMARVPVDQIFNPNAYQKWNNGSFSTPGIGGVSTAVMKRDTNQGMTFVSNPGVSWNTYLQSYLSIARANNGFYFYTSPDGINWSTPTAIPGTSGYIYPSLMDFSQTSDMTTDQNLELWYGRDPGLGYHVLFRRPVTLTADNVPANTSTPTPTSTPNTGTSSTIPGANLSYNQSFTVPSSLPSGTYKIMAGLYTVVTGQPRTVLNPGPGVTNDGTNRYIVGSLAVNTTAPATPNGTGATSSNPAIYLASPSVVTAQPGQQISLNFNWGLSSIPANTRAFVHFVDASGNTVFQGDHELPPLPTPLPKTGTISVNPASGSQISNQDFSVTVALNGGGAAFDAAEATVTLSSNLGIQSISVPNSNPCNLSYVVSPSTTNPSFAGALLGSQSTGCNVYTMTLRPLGSGTGTITITNGSIKSAVTSSEIFSSAQNGTYTMSAPTSTPTPTFTPTPTLSPTPTPSPTLTPTSTPTPTPTNSPTPTLSAACLALTRKLGDTNGDGTVNDLDLSDIAKDWNKSTGLTNPGTDLNCDKSVNLTDLSVFAKSYIQ